MEKELLLSFLYENSKSYNETLEVLVEVSENLDNSILSEEEVEVIKDNINGELLLNTLDLRDKALKEVVEVKEDLIELRDETKDYLVQNLADFKDLKSNYNFNEIRVPIAVYTDYITDVIEEDIPYIMDIPHLLNTISTLLSDPIAIDTDSLMSLLFIDKKDCPFKKIHEELAEGKSLSRDEKYELWFQFNLRNGSPDLNRIFCYYKEFIMSLGLSNLIKLLGAIKDKLENIENRNLIATRNRLMNFLIIFDTLKTLSMAISITNEFVRQSLDTITENDSL